MSPIEAQQNQSRAFDLNAWSGELLEGFAEGAAQVSAKLDPLLRSPALPIADGAGNLASANKEVWKAVTEADAPRLGLSADYLRRYSPSSLRTGPLAEVMSVTGSALNAATGILEVGQALKQDLETENRSYSRTLEASVKSTGKIAIGGGITTLAAGVGVAIGAPAIVGIGVGAAAAVGAGYLFDRAWEGIKSWWG